MVRHVICATSFTLIIGCGCPAPEPQAPGMSFEKAFGLDGAPGPLPSEAATVPPVECQSSPHDDYVCLDPREVQLVAGASYRMVGIEKRTGFSLIQAQGCQHYLCNMRAGCVPSSLWNLAACIETSSCCKAVNRGVIMQYDDPAPTPTTLPEAFHTPKTPLRPRPAQSAPSKAMGEANPWFKYYPESPYP